MKNILIIFILSFGSLQAQERYAEEEINELLVQEINQQRQAEGLKILKSEEILDAAAFEQARYIMKLGKITHEQDNSKKKTLMDRILLFEGLYAEAGENAAKISLGSKESVKPKGPRVEIKTQEMAVKAAVASWLEEEDSRLNLQDPNFYTLGSSVVFDEDGALILVVITASNAYQKLGKGKAELNFHGIEPYTKENCDKFLENHPTLPQLFSDAFKVENGELFFEFHSLAFMEEILSNSSDGIAADLIQRDQFSCREGIRLFPTEINDGFLLPPFKKGVLNTLNLAKSEGGVKVSFGKLPDFYNAETTEINGVIIKKGTYCETAPYNKVETKNLSWFDQSYLLAGNRDTNVIEVKDTIFQSYLVSTEWRDFLEKRVQTLTQMGFDFSAIQVVYFDSPLQYHSKNEATPVFNSLGLNNLTQVERKIAWKEYDDYARGTFLQFDTEGMDTTDLVKFLDEKRITDTSLNRFLLNLNSVEVTFAGKFSLSKAVSNEQLLKNYAFFMNENNIEAASFLQAELIERSAAKSLSPSLIPMADPSQKENTLPLINNQIILNHLLGKEKYDGNEIHIAFLEIHLIDQAQQQIAFNKHISTLQHWSKAAANVGDMADWLKQFKKLSTQEIPTSSYAKALLNYYLIAADYYYETEKFELRKKAFQEIVKWYTKANLTDQELLDLAKYLCFQDQFSRAIEVMKTTVEKDEVDQQLLFYFLQIAIYDQEQVPKPAYNKLVEKASRLYPKAFCDLFSLQKMGIQPLKDAEVRKLYCSHCE